VRFAISKIPRLHDRVAPELGRLTPPTWTVDEEFDLDYHVRHMALPKPGSMRQLFDLCTRIYEDPFDRTRPLWLYVVIDGVEGNKAALLSKLHHSISDGISAMRMSALYIDHERDAPPSPKVDLGQVISDAAAAQKADTSEGGPPPTTLTGAATASMSHLARRQAGIARRLTETASTWGNEPRKALDAGQKAVDVARSTIGQVRGGGGGGEGTSGSPLWTKRSRRRHLEHVRVPLDDLKAAGQRMNASINDMFVAGTVIAALRYHDKRGATVNALNISFVVSTRTDSAIGGNSFSPTRLQAPGGEMTLEERVADLRDRMAEKRAGSGSGGGIASFAGLANLLPTSFMTRVARSQVTKMDFATSNLRGARVPLYVCGSEVLFNATMGPVAGTAFNATTISYNGNLDIGIFLDPEAIDEPDDLRRCFEEAFADLIAGSSHRSAPARATSDSATARAASRKASTTKAATRKPTSPRTAATSHNRASSRTVAPPKAPVSRT
jgi:WS/DGAT/MGAT family acyltransferase